MVEFLDKIIAQKVLEVEQMLEEKLSARKQTYRFFDHVMENSQKMNIIAEVKRASPSKGDICLNVDVVAQAQQYEKAGAAAISVLTDTSFFKGSIEDLRKVAAAVKIPVLCKDFIIDKKQIIRARNAGASLILLIVAALKEDQLKELYAYAKELELEVLVEVHNEAELLVAERLGAQLIGVNNRNLHTFVVDLSVSEQLAPMLKRPNDCCYISESGIREPKDVLRLKNAYRAVLVGEALMRNNNPNLAAQELQINRSAGLDGVVGGKS